MSAYRSFVEGGVTPIDPLDASQWNSVQSRRVRYGMMWSIFDNSVYRDVHSAAKSIRATYGLYQHIRSIASPAYRIGTFYATHLMGGALDPQAGDGDKVESCLPIVTENEALRVALATVWRDSIWNINKNIWTLNGTIMGDAPLEVVDDVQRGKVYLKAMHPGRIKSLDTDPQGNVKAYTLEYSRPDPRIAFVDRPNSDPSMQHTVTYTEEVTRELDNVVYRRYLNGQAYDWDDYPSTWTQPYGFIPLVLAKHQDVGLEWGWSELQAGLPKFREIDDIASALDDQIRKAVNAPWLFNFPKPSSAVAIGRTTPTRANPEPGRGELPALYINQESAKGQALIADLDVAAVSARISALQDELKQDYPELNLERHTASGDASGRALRYAQQPVSAKVQQRRAAYDSALVRAQQMAVAIGGMRGYAGYEGFSLDSYLSGDLDHSIGNRPVFAVDPLDRIEEDTAFWASIKAAVDAGYPLDLALRDKGYAEDKIALVVAAAAEKQAQAQATMDAQLAQANQKPPFGG